MSVIDGTTNTVIKTVHVANAYLYGSAYPVNQYVYVANDIGPIGPVDVIDISSSSLIKAIPVGILQFRRNTMLLMVTSM